MKRLSLFFTLAFVAVTIFAQESTQAGRKATFVRNGFWDNWFAGVGAGANYYVKGGDSEADLLKMLTVAPTIQVGKWYNPYFGARLKFQGGSLHAYFNSNDKFLHGKYVSGEADLLWNVSNYLCKYNESRFYSFIPYLGIGLGYGWDYKVSGKEVGSKQRNFTINGGIINKFRFTDRLSLDIDLSAALLKEQVDLDHDVAGTSYGKGENTYDGLVAASASLVFKLGKFGFKEAVLQDQSLIDDLNGQINRLRSENAELSKRPVNCPPCPEAKPQQPQQPQQATKSVYVPNVVFFRLNSATVDKNQEISIYNTAEYLKNNPQAKVKVVAYADKKTGTAAYNEKISEKRAKNVAKALTGKYNIDSSRVAVEWKGSTEQPYSNNEWNRVAIFIAD
jgi:outer membrane protein OmpA-like peptidoglycan-associated protein